MTAGNENSGSTHIDWGSVMLSSAFFSSDKTEAENFMRRVRDARLAEVDAIERMLGIEPTTAQIRRWHREQCRSTP